MTPATLFSPSSKFGDVDGQEELPKRMPELKGLGVMIRVKVKADHTSDIVAKRLMTAFLVSFNCALIYWWCRKQMSVETSSFGSEFIALKQCCEYLHSLRYKLHMMDIPCEAPAYMYSDYQYVLAYMTIPDSTLKKKLQGIAYHFVRGRFTRDEWQMLYINTHEIKADLLTKLLANVEKQKWFIRGILNHIFSLSVGVDEFQGGVGCV